MPDVRPPSEKVTGRDAQQLRKLVDLEQRKLTADRAVLLLAGEQEEVDSLLVRAETYNHKGASAAELRVAVRDLRRVLQISSGTDGQAKLLKIVEDKLRARIKADVAAAR